MEKAKRIGTSLLALCLLMTMLPSVSTNAFSDDSNASFIAKDSNTYESLDYANSDIEAYSPEKCFYISDDSSGVFMMEYEYYPYETDHRNYLTHEEVSQIAYLDGILFYNVVNDHTIKALDLLQKKTDVLVAADEEISRFAVTSSTVYYLSGNTIFSVDRSSGKQSVLIELPAINRFWLTSATTIEYISDTEETITIFDVSTGKTTQKENAISQIDVKSPAVAQTGKRGLSLTSLQSKFPHGKYWNHVGSSNNPDGYTSSPCTCHSGNCSYYGYCNCNSFSNAIQCFGYALKVAYDYYGSNPRNWSKVYNLNSLKAGDYIRYKNDGHSIWVTSVNGDTITFTDCNSTGRCQIRWGGTISKSTVLSTLSYVWVAPSGASAEVPEKPKVTTSQSQYTVGDSAVISWNSVTNNMYFWINIFKGDTLIVDQNMGTSTSYTLSNVSAGSYTVFVSANNGAGTSGSSVCYFSVVGDVPSAPTISASSDWIKTGETLMISWNAISGATGYEYYMAEYPYAFAYENYLVSGTTAESSVSFQASNLPNGRYCFFIHAKNAVGSSAQSNWLFFDVYNSDYTPTKVGMFNGHIYAVYDQDLSWTFAEQMCENAGGHLVTITSQDEYDYICSLIQSGGKDAYWIGARNDWTGSWYDSDNPYCWVSEEEFEFQKWYPGEPNSYGSGGNKEHFAEIRKSYNNQWNDKPNARTEDDGFILEIDAASWAPKATTTNGTSKYLLFDVGITWSEARAYCDYNGGHLATISSSSEDAAISNLLKEGSLPWFYLGGRSVGGTWKWLDDTTIPLSGSYSNWSDSNGTAQTGPTGWGNYLMKYKSTGTWIGMPNYDNPIDHIKFLGFVMEIDNAVNTLTFNPNGGSVTTTSKTIVYGDEYGDLPTPTYNNYIFGGWYTNATGGERITATSIVSVKTNQTLYAHWTHVCAGGHSYNYAVTTAPTTGAAGVLKGTCSKCGATTTVALPKLDTTNYTYAVVTAATCTANGTGRYTWKTTTYGTFTFDVSLPKTDHNYTYAVTTAPTTSAAGILTGTCSKCGGTTSVTLPKLDATNYNYAVVTAATCTANGTGRYTWKTTTYGTFAFDVTIPKTGHSYTYAVTTAPTTSAGGALTGTCSKCGGSTVVTLPKLNTTDYTYTVVTAATCTANGTGRYTWKTTTYGTFTFDVSIPKTDHNYTYAVTTAPTTSAAGVLTGTCSKCNGTTTVALPKLDTTNYNYTVVTAATCTANGTGRYTWKTTTYGTFTFDVSIPKTNHSYTYAVTKAPTTSATGTLTGTCANCGGTTTVTLPKLNTTDYTYSVVTAATCTATGTGRYTWKTTTYGTFSFDVTIAKTAHSYVDTVTAPTCTEQGYTTHTCSVCGNTYNDTYIAALGHKPGTAVEENRVSPTCTENGGFDTVTYCTICGAELSRVHTNLSALGHIWDDGVIDPSPSCTADGAKTYTCQRCGETKTEAIAATGHTAGESAKENEVAATCTTAGGYDMVIRCTVCNAILYTEHFEIAALIHDYQAVVTAPTCTEGGYTTYICSRCGDSYVADETAALGHDWNEPEYVWADDYSTVTATRTCKNDANHVETETVNTTSEVTKEATYEEEGEITYTALFENAAFATQTKTVATPKLDGSKPYEPCNGGEDCPGRIFTDMPAKGNWAHDAIDWAIVNKITAGTSATTFSPNAGCTRAQVVTFLWRAAKEPAPTSKENPFKDVKESDYFYNAVLWAVEKGITVGTDPDKFSPGETCTRAQIVTFLYRYEGKPEVKPDDSFTDVKPGDYFADSVAWAVANGITKGTDPGKFSPSDTCTREQVVTFLYRDIAE